MLEHDDACCKTCEYWMLKYQQCSHPFQPAGEAGEYQAPPDRCCELYEVAGAWEEATDA